VKSQKHNQGELSELRVLIEKELVESLGRMAKKTGVSLEDLVAIAIKRFRSTHSDYEDKEPRIE
jgi:predicted HicB family RNase H-like nuclease